jgi:hypothetical protein
MGIEVPVHTGLKCWQKYDLNVILKVKKIKEATMKPL